MKTAFAKHLKNRLTSRTAYYYPLHNLPSSGLLSKDVNITLYKTTVFPCTI
jgi:hypothetical protein